MAAAHRSPEPPVVDRLQGEPQKFNFYQLVRLLEMLRPHAQSVASSGDPSREPVRFRGSFSLAFPASDVGDAKFPPQGAETDALPEVTANLMSVGGAHGPLPHPLTEWVLERNEAKDFALRDFLDIFNHRLLSLLYRVRRQNRLGMEWKSPEEHAFSGFLMAFMGLHTEGLQDRLGIPDRALLRYAGLLTKTPRDATGLEALLSDFFRMPVRCLQLRGAMRTLDADQWTHIGLSGRNQVLGQDALLGTSVWDQQAGIELELGPVGWKSYLDFLPGRGGLRALCALVRFYIGPGFDVQVTLRLRGEQIPAALLSAEAALGAAVAEPAAPPAAPAPIRGAALGLTAFLSYGTVLHGQPIVRLGVIARYRDEPQRSLP